MAANSIEIQLRELKDTITQLNNTINKLNATIASKDEELAWFRNKVFGSTSEKSKIVMPGQLSIFDESVEVEKPTEIIEPEIIATKHIRKKRPTLDEQFKNLPVKQIVVDTLKDEDKICPICKTNLIPIGHEVIRTEIKFTAPKLEKIEYIATTYGCPKCNKENEETVFVKDNGIPALIEGSYASESLVAYVIQQKYGLFIPLNRLEGYSKELGAPITRATFARWIIIIAKERLQPLYDYFHRQALKRRYFMMDETPVQVLKEKDSRPQSKSYFWVCRTGEDDLSPIVLYSYTSNRAGDNAKKFLQGVESGYYLMTDAFSGYDKLTDAKRCCCYAHIRRKFTDIIPKGKEIDYTNPAVQAVAYINKLFAYERSYKEKGLSKKRIQNRRLKDQKPIVEGFLAWLKTVQAKDNEGLKKAISYALNRESQLFTYIEDGSCSLSNNLSEQAIKPVTLGRKNWLFSDTPEGANANAICLTIVQMAKMYGLDLHKYIEYILCNRPSNNSTDEELEKLSPWNAETKSICKSETE